MGKDLFYKMSEKNLKLMSSVLQLFTMVKDNWWSDEFLLCTVKLSVF